jgi:hypothetical protein
MNQHELVGRAVLSRSNAQRKRVYVAEFGGDVLIQQLSARQVAATQILAQESVDSAGTVKDRAKLSRLAFAIMRDSWINEDGTPVLSDDDYEAMADQPHAATEVLITAIRDFSSLDPEATRQAKKNLEPTRNGASGIS